MSQSGVKLCHLRAHRPSFTGVSRKRINVHGSPRAKRNNSADYIAIAGFEVARTGLRSRNGWVASSKATRCIYSRTAPYCTLSEARSGRIEVWV